MGEAKVTEKGEKSIKAALISRLPLRAQPPWGSSEESHRVQFCVIPPR